MLADAHGVYSAIVALTINVLGPECFLGTKARRPAWCPRLEEFPSPFTSHLSWRCWGVGFFLCFRMFLLLIKSNAFLLICLYYFVKVYLNFSAVLVTESLTESAEKWGMSSPLSVFSRDAKVAQLIHLSASLSIRPLSVTIIASWTAVTYGNQL